MTEPHQRGQAAGPVALPPPQVGPAADPQPSTAAGICGTPPLGNSVPPHMATTTPLAHNAGIAGYAYGRRRAELDAGIPDEEVAQDVLTVEQDIRVHALAAVARLGWEFESDDEVLDLAGRFAAYITTGDTDPEARDVDDPLQAEYGPNVLCTCPDPCPAEHVHGAPWGCTGCDCRHYPAPSTMED